MNEESYRPDPIKQTFWKFLLPLQLGARVLLLGGDDIIAESLRRQTGTVEHLQTFDVGADRPLPFGDGMFDIVVFVDRAARFRRLRRGRATRHLVSELKRVRAPDGALAIVAVNPNWPPSPRLFAFLFASPRSVSGALTRAGLSLQHWLLSPGNANPRYLFSLERRGLSRGDHLSWRGRLRRRLTETFLWNWLASEFVLIADDGRRVAFLERLVADIDRRTGAKGAYISGIQTGNPATCLVRIKLARASGALIVRIPIDNHSLARCETNFQFFGIAAAYIPARVPRPILRGCIDNQDYFVEEVLVGITVDEPKFPLNAIADAATSLLIEMHSASRGEDLNALAQFVGETCARARDKGLIDATARDAVAAYCRDRLVTGNAPTVLFHGDYKIENLILAPESFAIRGLIDWDLARSAGPATVDLLFLLVYRRITASGESFERVYIDTVLTDAWDAEERVLLQRYSAALGIDANDMLAYKALLWLHHFAFRMSHVENSTLFETGTAELFSRIAAQHTRGVA